MSMHQWRFGRQAQLSFRTHPSACVSVTAITQKIATTVWCCKVSPGVCLNLSGSTFARKSRLHLSFSGMDRTETPKVPVERNVYDFHSCKREFGRAQLLLAAAAGGLHQKKAGALLELDRANSDAEGGQNALRLTGEDVCEGGLRRYFYAASRPPAPLKPTPAEPTPAKPAPKPTAQAPVATPGSALTTQATAAAQAQGQPEQPPRTGSLAAGQRKPRLKAVDTSTI